MQSLKIKTSQKIRKKWRQDQVKKKPNLSRRDESNDRISGGIKRKENNDERNDRIQEATRLPGTELQAEGNRDDSREIALN